MQCLLAHAAALVLTVETEHRLLRCGCLGQCLCRGARHLPCRIRSGSARSRGVLRSDGTGGGSIAPGLCGVRQLLAPDVNRRTRLAELDGIIRDVREDAAEVDRIAAEGCVPDIIPAPVDLIMHALLLCLPLGIPVDLQERLHDIEVELPLLERTARELVHIEDVVHERHEVLERLPLSCTDLRQHLEVSRILIGEVHETDDAVQRGPDVVAHVRQEAGLHLAFPLRRFRLVDEVELTALHITDAAHGRQHVGDASRFVSLLHHEGKAMPAAVHHLVLGVEDLFILHALRKRREVHELPHRFAVRRRHQCVTYLPKTHRCALLTPRDFRTLAMIRYLLHGILHEVDPYDGRVGLRDRRDDLITKLRLIERRLQFLLNCGLPLHDVVNAAEADQRVHLSLRVICPDDLRLEEAMPGRRRHTLVVIRHPRPLCQQLSEIRHPKPCPERFPRLRIKISIEVNIRKLVEVRIVPVHEPTGIGILRDMQDLERTGVDIHIIDGGVVGAELVQHLLLVRELLVHFLQLLVLALLLDDLLLDVVENAHAVAGLAGRQRLDAEVGAGPLRYDIERLVGIFICCPVVVRQPLAAAARM